MGNIQYFDWGSIEWIYEPDMKNSSHIIYIGFSTILPGRRQKEHIHYGDEQFLYVLSGKGVQLVEGRKSIKEPGSLFYIKAGSVHEAINTGKEPITELLLSTPAYYDKTTHLNSMLARKEIKTGGLKNIAILNGKIKALFNESIKILGVPIAIFDNMNKLIMASDNFPEFCKKNCRIDMDIKNCSLYSISDEYGPPHYKEPSAFVCQYGLRVFTMPIIVNTSIIGAIKGGHIRIYEKTQNCSIKKSDLKDESYYSLFDQMQIIHTGRIMAILEYIKALSKNISNYYSLENAEMELSRKESIIEDITRNELLLEENLKNTREQVLSVQINNHFLFNTLNALASLSIKEGSYRTYESIIRLANILRYSLGSSNSTAKLDKEMEFILDYLELQKLRYGERLHIDIKISKEAMSSKVPFNFIQPIVENSFVHGFKDKLGVLSIIIECKELKDEIFIKIEDNGSGLYEKEVEQLNNTVKDIHQSRNLSGLMMVHRKLESLYHDRFKFRISSKKGIGTIISITLPTIEEVI